MNTGHLRVFCSVLFLASIFLAPDCSAQRSGLRALQAEIKQLKERVARNPADANLRIQLGNALLDAGDPGGAIAQYKEAIRLEPQNAGAYLNLGLAYRRKASFDEAIAAYKKYLELNPNDALVHFDVGDLYYSQKRLYDEAIAAYKAGLRLDPNNATAYFVLGGAYREKGLLDNAIATYKKYLELDPNNPSGYVEIGDTFETMGLYSEALALYQRAGDLGNPDLWHGPLGSVLGMQGRFEEARKEFREALRVWPDDAEAQRGIAWTYFAESRFEDAIRELQKHFAMKKSPRIYQVITLSFSLRHLGRIAEAKKLWEDFGQHFQSNDWAGYLFRYHAGKLTEPDLLARADNNEDRCEAFFYIGYEYLLQGDIPKAREYFQKTLETRVLRYWEYLVARIKLEQLVKM